MISRYICCDLAPLSNEEIWATKYLRRSLTNEQYMLITHYSPVTAWEGGKGHHLRAGTNCLYNLQYASNKIMMPLVGTRDFSRC